MRIVSGQHKGRALSSPSGLATRPTSDRARQAVFNILEHAAWRERDIIADADILDVFAGTGAMGLEALSRGARHAVFIEQSHDAVKCCDDNIRNLGEVARGIILKQDATKIKQRPLYIAPRTLVFLDPPYGQNLGREALAALAKTSWLADNAICVLEIAKKNPEALPPDFTLLDTRHYGVARVDFIRWSGSVIQS